MFSSNDLRPEIIERAFEWTLGSYVTTICATGWTCEALT